MVGEVVVTMTFVQRNPSGFASDERRIVKDDTPSPTVMAGGIGGDDTSHYYIEDDGRSVTADLSKPPYRVPSMTDVAATLKNGYRIVSTFSGCGGSCLGFEMAGYQVLWASEFVPAAQEVYRLNHPGVILDTRDIRQVQASDILAATGLVVGEIDVLEGSPPCASFSTAGKREKDWGKVKAYSDTAQRADDLFFEFVRLVDGLKPKVFVAENVSGLVKGTAKGYFKRILAAMKATGYRVEAKLLDAQWLGVPQMRQRIIFIGVREDLGVAPAFPKPLPYRYSVREALPWIVRQGDNGGFGGGPHLPTAEPSPTIGAGPQTGNGRYPASAVEAIIGITGRTGHGFRRVPSELDEPFNAVLTSDPEQTRYEVETVRVMHTPGGPNGTLFNGGDVTNQPAPTVLAGRGTGRSRSDDFWVETDISRYAIGAEWDKLKPGESTYYGGRLPEPSPDAPCPTVTQMGGEISAASVTHPTERRKFTIAELKRICAFPDDFVLTGSYAQQWERLGRAVPPLMMRAVAQVIRDEVLAKCP